MKKTLILAALALTACTAKAPLSQEVVRSEIARNPEASFIDGLEGKLKWNYTTGLELQALLDAGADADYVDAWYDAIIAEDGSIGVNYKKSNYSLDHICPGRTLFDLYDLTGKEKYRKAMDSLYVQLQNQPRTPEGGFWHKNAYPNQMWLDGLYMAQPFYAEYTSRYVADSLKAANYRDIVSQFQICWDHCYDAATGLPRHAWDSSHEMFWCEPETGRSKHAWGRACGWYAMALADVIPYIPVECGRNSLIDILNSLCDGISKVADPETGLWYQVLDRPAEEGNYLEATASAMFTYVLLKGTREGWIKGFTRSQAREKFRSMVKSFVTTDKEGLLDLNYCCEVAGLGGKENRSGTYDYYINEKIRSNDPKGIGPLIWAALEYEKR